MEKNYLIVADTYYPDKNSAAIQLRDLSRELARKGNKVIILSARQDQGLDYYLDENDILILKASSKSPKNSKNYLERLILEIMLPYRLYQTVKKYGIQMQNTNLYVYSPSIFLFIIRYFLKIPKNNSILILRDIFPDWAYGVGLIKSKFTFYILKLVSRLQYLSFSRVYCQSDRDTNFINKVSGNAHKLPNWLSDENLNNKQEIPEILSEYLSSSRRTIVYAGKVGRAQNIRKLVEIAIACRNSSFQFLIIGSGFEFDAVKQYAAKYNLENLLIHEVVEHEVLNGVLRKCEVGYVSLDKNIVSENIPGKFINYLANGLYVLCDSGKNRELAWYFDQYNIGFIGNISDGEEGLFALQAIFVNSNSEAMNCFKENFSVQKALEILINNG